MGSWPIWQTHGGDANLPPDDGQELKGLITRLSESTSALSLGRYTYDASLMIRLFEGAEPATQDHVSFLEKDEVAREFKKSGGPSKPIISGVKANATVIP